MFCRAPWAAGTAKSRARHRAATFGRGRFFDVLFSCLLLRPGVSAAQLLNKTPFCIFI
jgi:hypothetical protein